MRAELELKLSDGVGSVRAGELVLVLVHASCALFELSSESASCCVAGRVAFCCRRYFWKEFLCVYDFDSSSLNHSTGIIPTSMFTSSQCSLSLTHTLYVLYSLRTRSDRTVQNRSTVQ